MRAVLLGFTFLTACAGVGASIQGPVNRRCLQAGLAQCNEVTAEVVAYADGDADARRRLAVGLATMPPAKLRQFVVALGDVRRDGLGEDELRVLGEVAATAARVAQEAERAAWSSQSVLPPALAPSALPMPTSVFPPPLRASTAPPTGSAGQPGSGLDAPITDARHALTADTDPTRIEGGTATWSKAAATIPCGEGNAERCVKLFEGALIVTDLKVSCARGAFASVARAGSASRWTLAGAAAAPVAAHGSRLAVRADEALLFGVEGERTSDGGKRAKSEASCTILWSGFRPYTIARSVLDSMDDIGY